MILKLGMQHRGLRFYKVYINDDPGLPLTYFTARSNLVNLSSYIGKSENNGFLTTNAACDCIIFISQTKTCLDGQACFQLYIFVQFGHYTYVLWFGNLINKCLQRVADSKKG